MKPRLIDRIEEIHADDWNALEGTQTAFTCHEFLVALERSGSVAPATGWFPSHLVWESGGKLAAAMPLYRKTHSYGEYVFDWRWAEAYQQTGLPYYPKLLCAIPFTPVPGPRLFHSSEVDRHELCGKSIEFLEQYLVSAGISSLHLLFPDQGLTGELKIKNSLERQDIQFVWRNHDYGSFEDFLTNLRSSKRKQLRRERRRVDEQSTEVTRLYGSEIDIPSMEFFCRCYQETYLKRSGHKGYLSQTFFLELLRTIPQRLMLVVAKRNDQPIASALFFVDHDQLSGRYWGCLHELDCLHFEVCYYQGIEFCIEKNLAMFNPGTQGEHKLVRGFEPLRTHSFHWIAEPQFREAVKRSLGRECHYMDAYEQAARSHLPFREN